MSKVGDYWAIVSVNLVRRTADAAAFNNWYDKLHVPEFVASTGFSHGWRISHIPHSGQRGNDPQEYSAIYDVDRIEDFVAALDASPSAGHSWGEWEGRVSDWTRFFFQVLYHQPLKGRARGKAWVLIRSELDRDVIAQATDVPGLVPQGAHPRGRSALRRISDMAAALRPSRESARQTRIRLSGSVRGR